MAQWHQFRMFLALHITKCSYINAQSHQPGLWQFPVGCLLGQVSWSHLKATRAPMDVRQADEWGPSKSIPVNFWQRYTFELLVYSCTCRMVVKSETWNYACIRPLLANVITYIVWQPIVAACSWINNLNTRGLEAYIRTKKILKNISFEVELVL